MKNGVDDDQCFKWAVTRALNPVASNPERVTLQLRRQSQELNWEGVTFPTPFDGPEIKTFEANNDLTVVILGYEMVFKEGAYVPIVFPLRKKNSKTVHLLLNQEEDEFAETDRGKPRKVEVKYRTIV